jgi:hypothetical protein
MAHFAELDASNLVVRVVSVANCECQDAEGHECEHLGVSFCQQHFGGRWVQTSYNGRIRKRYAGIGFSYDPSRDAFIPPQPFPSWTLDEATCQWQSPVQRPASGIYRWAESTLSWVLVG